MPTELVGKLPSSSFHLSFIFLSHSEPASLTHLHLFTTKPKLSSPFYLSHFPSHSLLSLPPPTSSPQFTISPTALSLPPVFHRRFRKSQPLPSIYEIAHVISCLALPHPSPSPPISLSECTLPGPRLLKSSCSKNTGTPKMISRG